MFCAGAVGWGFVIAATLVGAVGTLAGTDAGGVTFGACGAGAGVGVGAGAAATFGCSVATPAGTRKGLLVNGQTTFEPALMPRTSTRRGGFV